MFRDWNPLRMRRRQVWQIMLERHCRKQRYQTSKSYFSSNNFKIKYGMKKPKLMSRVPNE